MRRILLALPAALAAGALPQAADAAVVPSISAGTLTITGNAADDQITLRLAPGAPGSLQLVTPGGSRAAFDRAAFSRIEIRAGAGADTVRIDESGGVFTDTETTTIDTGAGADVISGGSGGEAIAAGDDADVVRPGAGDDTVALGAGDDTAIHAAGDARDALDGESGADLLRVEGSADAEEITVQAVGARARVTRDTDPALADAAGIERAEVNAAGGGDLVDLGDLTGTPLQRVDADLGAADGAPDAIAAQGGARAETVDVRMSGAAVLVRGLAPSVLRVLNARPAEDRLALFAGDDADTLVAGAGVGASIGFAFDGGAGADRALISGSSASERYRAARNGAGVRLERAAGAAATDLTGVERLDLALLGGADRFDVADLAGTGMTAVHADLGGGDAATDEVSVVGTAAGDDIGVAAGTVSGLPAAVTLARAEPRDRLSVDALGGDDSIDSTAVPTIAFRLEASGGAGDDVLLGGNADDVMVGGDGADVLFAGGGDNVVLGGAGDDVLRGESGDDVLDGQAGADILIGGAGDDILLNGEVVFDD